MTIDSASLTVIAGASAIVSLFAYALIVLRVRSRHSNLWKSLGRPSGLFNPIRFSDQYMADYVQKFAWIKSGDSLLVALGSIWWGSILLMIASFAFALIS